ncbi:type II toxin-antitoxin system HicB family antitoxin [Marvinbryantia sp.]|uniref:type II toxin-antitoxin system HicB family antitoxin n=1 Tax=Marvinbryantia sp. TaxID=2496532 RepID=UPI0025DB098F|nr:type II toxin-antitoxin system HicB family antitoxin [uncultured Marvinbryantia sp.]
MRFVYPAVFHKTETNTYEGFFPDLDDCHAEGETLDEALDNAIEAARDWITLELEEGNILPSISEDDDLTLKEGEFVRNIAVTIRLMDGWDE